MTRPLLQHLLADGVRAVAHIHHSHGVKAAVAVTQLAERFPQWTPDFWDTALRRAQWDKEPRVDALAVAPTMDVPVRRAQTMIARSVLPASYAAVRSWAAKEGGDAVLSHYLEAACADPGYLGHRLSILLAFVQSWPLYRQTDLEGAWLDRVCEFLIACRFTPQACDPANAPLEVQDVLAKVLQRPGFFGHHVIMLMWAMRLRGALTAAQFASALAWASAAASTTYADDEDNLTLAASGPVTSPQALEDGIRTLLTQGTPNIHLLTLADAIAWLWGRVAALQQAQLLELARVFSRA
jgi:hypothetical protein